MNVIVCHPFDRDAVWLYLELKKRGNPVWLLSPEQILSSRRLTQRFDSQSDEFVLATHSGLTLRNNQIEFFFNRSRIADPPLWRRSRESERDYVCAEMTALLLSWLHQVKEKCLMINPPVGPSLCGADWSQGQWSKAALDAGFPRVDFDSADTFQRVLVVGGKVIAGLKSDKLAARCIALAQIAQSPLLEVSLQDDGRTFAAANAFPAFRSYGEKFLALLARQLNWKTS